MISRFVAGAVTIVLFLSFLATLAGVIAWGLQLLLAKWAYICGHRPIGFWPIFVIVVLLAFVGFWLNERDRI